MCHVRVFRHNYLNEGRGLAHATMHISPRRNAAQSMPQMGMSIYLVNFLRSQVCVRSVTFKGALWTSLNRVSLCLICVKFFLFSNLVMLLTDETLLLQREIRVYFWRFL